MRAAATRLLAAAVLLATPAAVHAQAAADAPNVFLDCRATGCDSDHIRTEITFVNWMRDRTDADVYVLATSQGTGGGGYSYRISTFGSRRFAGDSAELRLTVPQNSTAAERRDALTRRLALALVRYAALTDAAEAVAVSSASGSVLASEPAADPWNRWIFSAAVSAQIEGESRQAEREFDVSFDAGRVTADLKLELELDGEYSEEEFRLSDGRRITSIRRDFEAEAVVAKAVARLWSAGVLGTVGTSTFENQDFYSHLAALVEFSFYPYEDFSRRRMTLRYSVGGSQFNYSDTTIYNRTSEVRPRHELALNTNFRQPWGSANAELSGSHYLDDLRRYRLASWLNLNIRVLRGFSLDVSGSYQRVRDQIYIPKGDASDEEVLLRRRALETGYRYSTSVGLRYTFGSIYNSIVNPRLGS